MILALVLYFLDLAKAFDSVSHEILLRKMHHYGIRGKALELFKSYLSSRSQYVKLNASKSSLMGIEFGVPQGSILGPLLFLLFINDLPNASKFYIKLFADDTFLCAQDKDFSNLEREVNIELDKVFVWLASNRLTLNYKKSKFMIVTNKQVPEMSIKINDVSLERCTSYKYLGMVMDEKLKWNFHIDYISKKISKGCGALAKLRNCVSMNVLKNVYHALVHSYLRYGILIWGHAAQSILDPIQVLANRAIRIMTNAPFGNVDLKSVYQELKILEVSRICLLETGKFEFKSKNKLLPTSIGNYFESQEIQHTYGLRSITRGGPPRFFSHTKIGEKSLQYIVRKFGITCHPILNQVSLSISSKKDIKHF